MFDDFRSFVEYLSSVGELRKIEGADWDLEIGTITELMAERQGPALLFDEIKGYPKGYRIACNVIMTPKRQRIALGISEAVSEEDIIRDWKDRLKQIKLVPPREVATGPVMKNILTGDKVNMLRFPTPRWHELDGGRYIGTGVVIITQDPDEGWVNCGTYRIMIQDEKTLAFHSSPGKHANLIRQKYWGSGKDCPVIIAFGQDMFLFTMSTIGLKWGTSELEVAGYMKGKPIDVIKGSITGLPIPATAEIAIEGFSPPPSVDARPEGPLGEWTGYYASGSRTEPVVQVRAIYHRDDPIVHGQPPVKPPLNSWYPIPLHSTGMLWNRLEMSGIPGIKSVYMHGPGSRVVAVISIKQGYLGHAKQVGAFVASILSGNSHGRWVIVVDEDIDPTNWESVMWAVTTRCDPETSIEIVRGFLSSRLDPTLPPEKREMGNFTTAKVIINACKPYHWQKDFPPVNRASDELRKKVIEKWSSLFV
jgi:4-hydroxy-3-polyprenylbenzoate decarboxylase